MYQTKKYKKTDERYCFDFMRQHPFATVIINGNRLLATHVPVLTEGNAQNFRLFTHIASHNEMRAYLNDGTEMLLVFHGAHDYISSSWYREKDISSEDVNSVIQHLDKRNPKLSQEIRKKHGTNN